MILLLLLWLGQITPASWLTSLLVLGKSLVNQKSSQKCHLTFVKVRILDKVIGLWAFEVQTLYQKYQGPPIVVIFKWPYCFPFFLGEVVMSLELESAYESLLFRNELPVAWRLLAFRSEANLRDFLKDLDQRMKFFKVGFFWSATEIIFWTITL